MSVEHYENFPVASLLCPPRLRPAVLAIYGYARTADDLADEGDAPPSERLAKLASYRQELARAAGGEKGFSHWPEVFEPLARAIAEYRLPVGLLEDLLSAFERDVGNPLYADRSGVLDYCRQSANPIGRLLLHLYGVDDSRALARSDAICSALQLINFWQDLSIDLPRGRLYIPGVDAARHGLSKAALLRTVPVEAERTAWRSLLEDLVDWARRLMLEGQPLIHDIPGPMGWELRLVIQGGLRILDKIERQDFQSYRRRPRVGALDMPVMLWRALRMGTTRQAVFA